MFWPPRELDLLSVVELDLAALKRAVGRDLEFGLGAGDGAQIAAAPVRGNGNYTGFCNESIDREIAKATSLDATNPPAAQAIWSRVDRDVVDQAPWIVVANPQSVDFVSRRVGNYTYSPQYSALLDQMWVRQLTSEFQTASSLETTGHLDPSSDSATSGPDVAPP